MKSYILFAYERTIDGLLGGPNDVDRVLTAESDQIAIIVAQTRVDEVVSKQSDYSFDLVRVEDDMLVQIGSWAPVSANGEHLFSDRKIVYDASSSPIL